MSPARFFSRTASEDACPNTPVPGNTVIENFDFAFAIERAIEKRSEVATRIHRLDCLVG
jgi:hypothetical protein